MSTKYTREIKLFKANSYSILEIMVNEFLETEANSWLLQDIKFEVRPDDTYEYLAILTSNGSY